MSSIRVGHVKVGTRHRKDLGDLAELAESIREFGLLHPIVLDKDLNLVAGARRLEAVKTLGFSLIEVRIVAGLDEAARALSAERDENTCRKDFNPIEMKSLTDQLLAIEKPAAADRRTQNLPTSAPAPNGPAEPLGEEEDDDELAVAPSYDRYGARGRAEALAAKAAGWSRASYQRVSQVIAALDHANPAVVAAAEVLVAQLESDAITPREAARKIAEAKRSAAPPGQRGRTRQDVAERRLKVAELASLGNSASQIAKAVGLTESRVRILCKEHGIEILADKVLGSTRRLDSNRIIESMVATVRGFGGPLLDHVDFDALDSDLFGEWIDSLADAIASLTKLKRKLTETKESIRASA